MRAAPSSRAEPPAGGPWSVCGTDAGPEGGHHARVARFLQDHRIEVVVAHHMGEPMAQMLDRMGIDVRLGAGGDAGRAVVYASAGSARE